MFEQTRFPPQASMAIVHLLKGVVYGDSHPLVWKNLLDFQAIIQDYLAVIGLDVILDEAEGYAFVRQRAPAGDDTEAPDSPEVPRLIHRRPLSFPVSLLCALLRRKLAEHDASGGEARLVLTRDQIVEMLRVFLPESSNEARLIDQIDQYIARLVSFGFLRRLKAQDELYEVRRIIKALVDAVWLNELSEKLQNYRKHAEENSTGVERAGTDDAI